MPIKIQNKSKCTGCYSCVSICPKQCITMEVDAEGFWYPLVDNRNCINCDKCYSNCPVINIKPAERNFETVSYAAVNIQEQDRMNSSSGGVFRAVAEEIIDKDGVVFGAAFSDDFSVDTKFIETKDYLYELQGSKYVQSCIGDSFKKAKAFLDEGRLVLFTGTPCQISGLKAFLIKDYDNLLTIDLICHGVPSPLVWEKYLVHRKEAANSVIDSVSFRDKVFGWKRYSVKIGFSDKKEYLSEHDTDAFMKTFLGNYCLRPSCYDCAYKTEKRQSDITLADFWGIENVYPEMDDDKGTSLVIVHSQNGKDCFESISDKLIICEFPNQDIQKYNSAYLKSVDIPKERNLFLIEIEKSDFLTAYNQLQRAIQKNDLRIQIRKDFKKKRYRRMIRKIKKYVTKSY